MEKELLMDFFRYYCNTTNDEYLGREDAIVNDYLMYCSSEMSSILSPTTINMYSKAKQYLKEFYEKNFPETEFAKAKGSENEMGAITIHPNKFAFIMEQFANEIMVENFPTDLIQRMVNEAKMLQERNRLMSTRLQMFDDIMLILNTRTPSYGMQSGPESALQEAESFLYKIKNKQ